MKVKKQSLKVREGGYAGMCPLSRFIDTQSKSMVRVNQKVIILPDDAFRI